MPQRKSITLVTETLGRSLLSDAGTFGFMLLCIWLSSKTESLLWTITLFVLAVVAILAKAVLAKGDIHYFASAKEARNWLDRKLLEETTDLKLAPLSIQPPETAPKDGSQFLGHFKGQGEKLLPTI